MNPWSCAILSLKARWRFCLYRAFDCASIAWTLRCISSWATRGSLCSVLGTKNAFIPGIDQNIHFALRYCTTIEHVFFNGCTMYTVSWGSPIFCSSLRGRPTAFLSLCYILSSLMCISVGSRLSISYLNSCVVKRLLPSHAISCLSMQKLSGT